MRRVAVTGYGFTPGAWATDEPEANYEYFRAFLDDLPQANAKGWRRMSWPSKFAYVAMQVALGDDSPATEALSDGRTGLVIGSRYGCLSLFEEFHRVLLEEGPRAVSPTVFTTGVLNAPVGHASLGQGLQGPCHALVGAEAAGLEAIALGWELIQGGAADRVIAVGVEEAPPILFEALRAGSALPDGRLPAEGAVALVLEARESGGFAAIEAVASDRCGRRHGSAERHARLLRRVAGGVDVDSIMIPGTTGADGAREHDAATRMLGAPPAVLPAGERWYAPGIVSAFTAHQAVLEALDGKRSIATAAGGHGTTVAIRFDPPAAT